MRLPKFYNRRTPGARKCENSHPRSSRDRRVPITVRKPSADLGTSMRISPFIWATSLLADFTRIQSRNLGVFHPRHVHRGFASSLPVGNDFINLGAASGACGRDPQWPGHTTRCPGSPVPLSCFGRSSGYRHSAGTLVCGFKCSLLPRLSRQGELPSVRRQWLPPWRPMGGLGHWGSSAGCLIPPSFTLLRGPFFSGERCRGIHSSSSPFIRSPGHYPGVRRATFSVAELPAVWCGLLPRRVGGFSHRALGGNSLYLCRQKGGPASGQWPGRLITGSI
jgi:hypothetical protein